ncbi:hypothetical protein IWQ56_000888 [Coemansia nantahalensis]|nr:hypothetical protein IWQ56_000888 [Coemansia nantahalensis]
MAALINRLIYTLTIACLPDLLERTMGESPASNGTVTVAFGVGGLVAGMLTGYLSDRAQNRIGFQIGASVLGVAAGLILFFAERLYLVVLFRLVLGVASSISDTMLYATVADVYPASLLGSKMAVVFVFDNIGDMLGPLLGGKAYETMGLGGVSAIAIALSACSLVTNLVFVRNSLAVCSARAVGIGRLPEGEKASGGLLAVASIGGSTRDSAVSVAHSKSCVAEAASTIQGGQESTGRAKVQLARLLFCLPVAGPVASVFVATGLQTVMETVLPLRLYERFYYSPATISIAFLVGGGVLMVTIPLTGYINDVLVARYGELKRYYFIAGAVAAIFVAQIIIALSTSYAVLVFGYALFSAAEMAMVVPAQSAFGDYINASGSYAMAQCYSLAWLAEGLASILLPPVASAIYAAASFPSTSLKFGLNARKPALGAAGAQARARTDGGDSGGSVRSVFRGSPADDPDDEPALPPPAAFSGGSQAREAERLASEIAASDPSVYAYDEVYDNLDQARSRAKQAQRSDDRGPRYMDKLIASAEQRKVQSDVVRERLLEKEREREGDLFADKEVIVTAGYKEIKEQRKQLVAEDEAREASAQTARRSDRHFGAATVGLYREFLDHVDREDAAIAAAAAAAVGGSAEAARPGPTDSQGVHLADAAGPASRKPEALGSGLNVMATSTRQRPADAQQQQQQPGVPAAAGGVQQDRAAGRQGRNGDRSSYVAMAAEMDRRDHVRDAEQERQHLELVKKYARRNDAAAVEAARQRYLERKQQAGATEMAARGLAAGDVQKVLRSAVDLAVGEGEYRHGRVAELHNNIVEYAAKKLGPLRPPAVKLIVTCAIAQNTGGLHISNCTRWDDAADSMVTHEFRNAAMTIVVTAYLITC